MNNVILLAIRDRDYALQNFKKLKSPENHKIYVLLRNKVQYRVRKAKLNLFKDKIAQCINSSSALRKTLNKLGISKKQSAASTIGLDIDSKLYSLPPSPQFRNEIHMW